MWIRGYTRRSKTLASLLTWDTLETPRIMKQRDGSLLTVLHLAPPDLDSALDIELMTQARQLNALFRRYGARWGFQGDVRRWRVTQYPQVPWPHWLAQRIEDERRAQWAQGQHFTNVTHLHVVYKPLRSLLPGWRRLIYEHMPEETAEESSLGDFEEEIARIVSMLKGCGIGATPLQNERLLTYLHSTVSRKHHRVAMPEPSCYLNRYLTDDDVTPGVIVQLGDWYLACVSPRAWTTATMPGMLSVLNALPVEFRCCVRYVPMDKRLAIDQARKHARKWEAKERQGQGNHRTSEVTDRSARERSEEAQDAWRRLANGDIMFGHLTTTVVVWDTDMGALRGKMQLIEGAFNDATMIAKAETLNTMDAWVGTLPGQMTANARQDPMHSFNFVHCFLGAMQPWAGEPWNDHLQGPALLHVTGKGQTAFDLSLHADDVGHSLIVGPTGSGKSTLVAFIALQFLKYPGAQVYAFDKGQSLRCATYAIDGQWFDIAEEVARMYGGDGHLDSAETSAWEQAWLPPPGGWQCFEMEELLHTPRIVPQILGPIFRAIEDRMTGAPTLLLLDEAWVYLDHPLFAERVREWLKTLRKKNASVIFSTQSLADAADSKIAAAVNESCMTRIFLANPRALEPQIGALYQAYGLNDRQRELIATMTPKRHYYYQGQAGSQVFDLTLGPVALAVTGASRPEDLAAIAATYRQHPDDFARAWLAQKGLV